MNAGLKKIFFQTMLLLLAGMTSAFANHGSRHDETDGARSVYREQTVGDQREAPADERRQVERGSRREEYRRNRSHDYPEKVSDGASETEAIPPSHRKTSRMTPEERRDLRRQINEAGQDIYGNSPKR